MEYDQEHNRGFQTEWRTARDLPDSYRVAGNDIVDHILDPSAEMMRKEDEAAQGDAAERTRVLEGLIKIIFQEYANAHPKPINVCRRLYALIAIYLPSALEENNSLINLAKTLQITKQGISVLILRMARELGAPRQHLTSEKQRTAWSAAKKGRPKASKDKAPRKKRTRYQLKRPRAARFNNLKNQLTKENT